MSNTVDRRVVEMQFDNKDFENNVQDSVKSLDKLKKSLNLEESAKGLSAFERAGQKFSLDGMVRAAEAVTGKFSIMGTIGDQVLRRIGDAAFNALKKMEGFVESLTIEPISTGMQEYETQINAIQTILSNTRDKMTKQGLSDAERLEIVNDRLDQLNHYADKTIYNFTEMTRNIGTFTAAGVELDTAVQSIQGIANLAAVSGSTSEQASRAMYQLSQAISTGIVRLMDWNSVVNAGMGGEVFQKALVRTAKAMGKTVDVTVTETDTAGKKVKKTVKRTVDEIIAEEGSFRESLSKGWLTSDILTATLEQFSWDFEQIAKEMGYDAANMEEGVLKAMELKKSELLAQGYTSEEAEEIIQLAKDATEAATKVKTFTQLFDTLKEAAQSGWTQTWEYIIGDFEEAKEMLTGISDFFGKIIDSSSDARNKIMKEWHDAGGRDMLWNDDPKKGPLGAFWNLTYGIKNMIDMIREEFQKIFPPATSQTLLNFTQRIQQATANFKAWTENSEGMDKIRRIVAGIAAAFDIAKTAIGYVWDGFKKLVGLGKSAAGGILEFAAGIGDWLVKAKESIKTSEGLQKFLQRIGSVITTVRDVVVNALKQVSTWIGKLWGKVKSSGILTKIGQGISDFVGKIPDAIAKVRDWIKGIMEYVKTSDTLRKTWDNIKRFFEPVIKSLGDFGKRLKEALSNFFNRDVSGEESLWARLKARLSAFGSAFSDWFGTVKTTVSNVWTNIKNFLTTFFTKTIPDFFNSKKLDASSILEKVKAIDWGKVLKTVLGVATFVEILKVVRNFSKIGKIADSFKNLTKTVKDIAKNGASLTKDGLFINGKNKSPIADTLLKIAASIGILVASIYVLAKMGNKSIMKGMGLLTLLATELLIVSASFSKMDLDGGSVLKASAAILLLVIPIKLLSAMKTADALKGIIGVGLILAELALFSRMMGKDFNGKQAGFIGLGIAVNLLVIAIKNLSKLNVGSMAKSLIAMEVLLLEMAAFTKRVSGKKVAGMIAMAIGINLMVTAVKRMGKLDMKTIAKGVIGLGSIMLAFGAMLKLSSGVNLGSALILLVTMAGSLLMFTEAFKRIDGSNTNDMLKFFASFAAMMTSMSIALEVLSTIPIVGALKGVANMAILVVGLGALFVGLGYLQSQWQGMTDFLEGGGNVLGQIGRAIGKFVGGIGAGSLEALSGGLVSYATNIKGLSDIADDRDYNAAVDIATSLAGLTKVVAPDSLGDWILACVGQKTSFERFVDTIGPFGEAMKAYATAVSGFSTLITTDEQAAVIAAATGITSFSEAIPEASFWDKLFGLPNDFSLFISGIGPFGEAMKAYATAVSGFSTLLTQKDNNAALDAIDGVRSFVETFDPSGGFMDTMEKALGKGSKIATLLEYAETLKLLGENLEIFSSSMEHVSADKVDYATKIFDSFQTFVGGLKSKGAAWQVVWEAIGSGSRFNDLTETASKMADFGSKFRTFSEGIADANLALVNFESAKEMFKAFRDFNDGVNGYNGSTDGMHYLLDLIEDCGTALQQLSYNMSGTSVDDLTAAANIINGIASLVESVNTSPSMSIEPIQKLLNNFSQITIPVFDTEGMESAKAFISSLAEGLGGATAILAITTSISDLSGQGTTAAEGTYKTWYSSGQYLAAGLGAGVSSMASTVRQSAVNVAAGAIRSIRMTWSVNSPSKVGEDLGMYFDLGIAGGLNNYAKVVSGSAVDMGKKVVDSASTMLRGVDGSIFDNLDPNPTICPVMDLTNIQNGVSAINGMFNPNNMQAIGLFRGMNLSRGVNQLNLDGGRITGTITDKNIVSNLEGLQTKLEELGEAVTNMKLVLDTGALIGGTSAKMDDALGTLAMRRGRGN